MKVRVLNALLGMWLLVSAFLWPHSLAQFHNAWITGALATMFAIMSMSGARWSRYPNFALGLWLFFSLVFLGVGSMATALNHVLVAVGLIITSFMPEHPRVTHDIPAPAR